jgi:hypothetical protein
LAVRGARGVVRPTVVLYNTRLKVGDPALADILAVAPAGRIYARDCVRPTGNQPGSFVVRERSLSKRRCIPKLAREKGREPMGDAQAAMAATSLSREAIRGAVARRAGGVPVRHNEV